MKKEKHCKDCRSWAWDCNDPDGICLNKSKKKCTREKRELWEKVERCEKCGTIFENQQCPECNKWINRVLVWHDEKNGSWTYCDRFEIMKLNNQIVGKCYVLYRIQHFFGENSANWIANFESLETAKNIASIIRINETCKKEMNEGF